MAAGVDLAQGGDRDGGVNLGRVEAGVAEQFLDGAQVRATAGRIRFGSLSVEARPSRPPPPPLS